MERSFANAKRYGFDRSRWRGLQKISIQELLICAIQNIKCLIKPRGAPLRAIASQITQEIREVAPCVAVTATAIAKRKDARHDIYVKIPKYTVPSAFFYYI